MAGLHMGQHPWVLRGMGGLMAVLAALVLLVGCSRKEPDPEPVRAVKLLQVGQQPLQKERTYAAEIRARTEVQLGFRVGGKLVQRPVQLGQSVQVGQLLAQIDAQDYALGAQAAQAQVQAARVQRDVAQADWQRFSALQAEGFISPVELDRHRARLQSAQAQLEQAQAQAAVQSHQSDYTELRAEAPAVVTGIYAEPGQVLSAGTAVLALAFDGPRDAVLAVPEDVRAQLRLQQPVQVQVWGSTQVWPGVVRELAARADPVARTFMVKVALEADAPQPALGATAQVRLALSEADGQAAAQAITVPSSAVWQNAQGRSAVWVWDAATSSVHAQVIEVAGVQGNDLVVRSGLQPGQQVVSTGVHVLSEGQKVVVFQPVAGAQP